MDSTCFKKFISVKLNMVGILKISTTLNKRKCKMQLDKLIRLKYSYKIYKEVEVFSIYFIKCINTNTVCITHTNV